MKRIVNPSGRRIGPAAPSLALTIERERGAAPPDVELSRIRAPRIGHMTS